MTTAHLKTTLQEERQGRYILVYLFYYSLEQCIGALTRH